MQSDVVFCLLLGSNQGREQRDLMSVSSDVLFADPLGVREGLVGLDENLPVQSEPFGSCEGSQSVSRLA